MKKSVVITFCLLLAQSVCFSAVLDSLKRKRWYAPDYIPLRFAGNIGMFATGVGYSLNRDRYDLSFLYGYVPASIAGTSVHMVTTRSAFPICKLAIQGRQLFVPYAGLGLTVEVGGNSFLFLPSEYPRGYYFAKSIHILGFVGMKVQHLFGDNRWLRGIEFGVEAGSFDAYIWYKSRSRSIKLREIITIAAGINFLLRR